MPAIADYVVVMDSAASLTRGGTNFVRKDFAVPDNVSPSRPAVLLYRIEAEHANNLKYTVSLNGTDVLTLVHSTDRFGTVHEVVGADVVRVGDNRFMAVATEGTGTLKISDVVLLIQVNV